MHTPENFDQTLKQQTVDAVREGEANPIMAGLKDEQVQAAFAERIEDLSINELDQYVINLIDQKDKLEKAFDDFHLEQTPEKTEKIALLLAEIAESLPVLGMFGGLAGLCGFAVGLVSVNPTIASSSLLAVIASYPLVTKFPSNSAERGLSDDEDDPLVIQKHAALRKTHETINSIVAAVSNQKDFWVR